MDGDIEVLRRIYDRFNARDIDAALAVLAEDVDIAPTRFGIMPKADCNCFSAGFEPSGADSMVWTGKVVMRVALRWC